MRAARGLLVLLAVVAGCSKSYGEAPSEDGGAIDPSAVSIAVTPTDLDFGAIECGSESPAKLVSIQNTGQVPASYDLVVPAGSPFTIVGPLTGTLPPMAAVTLQVSAKLEGSGNAATELVVTAGNSVQPVRLKAAGRGPALEITPALVDFGDVRMQSGSAPVDVEVTNRGTAPAVISSFEASADFAAALPAMPASIPPGAKSMVAVTMKPGSESAPLQAVLRPLLTQKLCGPTPSIAVKGRRVNSNVTVSGADFGKQQCTQTSSKSVVVTNYSPSALTFTASLKTGSAFTLVSGATGTIPAAPSSTTPTTGTIVLKPKPFGATLGTIAESLAIDVSGIAPPEGGLRSVPITVDVRGIILSIMPSSLGNFVSTGSTTDTKSFTVKNNGNENAVLDWTLQRTIGGVAWTSTPPVSISAGATGSGTVGFRPTGNGPHEAKITPALNVFFSTSVICPAVPALTVQGTGI